MSRHLEKRGGQRPAPCNPPLPSPAPAPLFLQRKCWLLTGDLAGATLTRDQNTWVGPKTCPDSPSNCGWYKSPANGKYIKLSETAANWNDAKTACETEGDALIKIESKEENNFAAQVTGEGSSLQIWRAEKEAINQLYNLGSKIGGENSPKLLERADRYVHLKSVFCPTPFFSSLCRQSTAQRRNSSVESPVKRAASCWKIVLGGVSLSLRNLDVEFFCVRDMFVENTNVRVRLVRA